MTITHAKNHRGQNDDNESISVTLKAHGRRNNDLVGEKEAAEILGVTPGTLQVWRSTGRYAIPFIKVGRLVKYRTDVLDRWLESRTHVSGYTK